MFAFQVCSGLPEGRAYIEHLQQQINNSYLHTSPPPPPGRRLSKVSFFIRTIYVYNGCSNGSNRELRAPSPAVLQEPMRLRARGPIVGDVDDVAVDEFPDRAALQSQRKSLGRSPRNSVWRKQRKPWGRMSSDPNYVFSSRFPTFRIMSGTAAFNLLVNRTHD